MGEMNAKKKDKQAQKDETWQSTFSASKQAANKLRYTNKFSQLVPEEMCGDQ